MKKRCAAKKGTPEFERYVRRGIKVCPEWSKSFTAFLQSVGDRPVGMTLERVDNNKGYEPGNVRWADRKTQAQNRRSARLLTWNGETMCVAEWERKFGWQSQTLQSRLQRGWSIERAITTPVGPPRI